MVQGQGVGNTPGPTNITTVPGYAELSPCAQCVLALPGTAALRCTTMTNVTPISQLLDCTTAPDWNCVCAAINVPEANATILDSGVCSSTDRQDITKVLLQFCLVLSGNDATTTTTPVPFSTQLPEATTSEIPTSTAPHTIAQSTGALESGGAGITSSPHLPMIPPVANTDIGSSPTPTSTLVASATNKTSSLSTGAIVGIAVGAAVGLLAAVAIGSLLFVRRRKPGVLEKDPVVLEQEPPENVKSVSVEPVVEPFNPYPGPNDVQR
jgi:hypothetical protein